MYPSPFRNNDEVKKVGCIKQQNITLDTVEYRQQYELFAPVKPLKKLIYFYRRWEEYKK